MYKDLIQKAQVLQEALPYIKEFYGKTLVIKYGGSLMLDEELKKQFAADIVLLKYVGINSIIVHGGGKEISKWMKKVGKKAVFIDGLRVTDSETMEITEMVLSGKINNEIVSLININGGKAVGLSGKDANLFMAKRKKSKSNQDLGFVGDIQNVDITLLNTLCEKGYIPVLSSVAIDDKGDTLNMNADHVAESIAVAIKAAKLIYLTNVQGLMLDRKLVRKLNIGEAKKILNHPEVTEGMLPKLSCSIKAIEGNVQKVHMINGGIEHAILLEVFTDVGIGTMIVKDA
jgi:acetylglutamate kinase